MTEGQACLLTGDCRLVLPTLPAQSVHTVVTSPPFWGLRSYLADTDPEKRQEIGQEESPEAHVAALLEVFTSVWEVLRDDGTLWLNLGDSMCSSGGHTAQGATSQRQGRASVTAQHAVKGNRVSGLKTKDLIGMPWLIAFALREQGWYLRSAITLCKNNPLPECLHPETHVFIRDDAGVRQVTLDMLLDAGTPYPEIMTPTGWKQVISAWETTKSAVIAFDAAKVSSVVCSPEHLWPVSHDRRVTVIRELPAARLRDKGYTDYLLHQTIDEWLTGTQGELYGETLDHELGWLVGLYAAEGGFGEVRGHRCKLTLHRDEVEIQTRATSIIERRFGCRVYRVLGPNYVSLRFSSAVWHQIAPAVISGKSTDKAVDLTVLLNAPRAFRQGVWEGYVAGDGSKRQSGCIVVSASPALRDTMAVVASSVGIVTSKSEARVIDPRTQKPSARFNLWTPYLTRRQHKAGTTTRQIPIRNKRVIPGPQRLIDLTVEGGLFLIEDGLITHNSVTDRPTNATEMLFLLTKQASYYYDQEAIREPHSPASLARQQRGRAEQHKWTDGPGGQTIAVDMGNCCHPGGRNKRNWWVLNSQGLSVPHFAAFPEALVAPCILAGTSEYGCCAACGAPWRRMTTATYTEAGRGNNNGVQKGADFRGTGAARPYETRKLKTTQTTGWEPACQCACPDTVPATVLDPFLGSGTTCRVATRLGRRSIGIELSPVYVEEIARERNAQLGLML